jgi:hypothetical protein
MYINCCLVSETYLLKHNYEKTDKLNFNSTIKFSNDLLNVNKQLKKVKSVYWLTSS